MATQRKRHEGTHHSQVSTETRRRLFYTAKATLPELITAILYSATIRPTSMGTNGVLAILPSDGLVTNGTRAKHTTVKQNHIHTKHSSVTKVRNKNKLFPKSVNATACIQTYCSTQKRGTPRSAHIWEPRTHTILILIQTNKLRRNGAAPLPPIACRPS